MVIPQAVGITLQVIEITSQAIEITSQAVTPWGENTFMSLENDLIVNLELTNKFRMCVYDTRKRFDCKFRTSE